MKDGGIQVDIYDKSRTFLKGIIEENIEEVNSLLKRHNGIHLEFNMPIKQGPKDLGEIIPWIKKDETVRYCCYYVDIFEENGHIKYKIEKRNKGHSVSAINTITEQFIEVDNSNMPSKNKVESDLKCIMDSVKEKIPKYLNVLYIQMQDKTNE